MSRQTFSIFRIGIVLIASCALAQAQLATSLTLNKREYILGESVIAQLTITNHTGQEIMLAGSAQRPWINFDISNTQGNIVTSRKAPAFGALKIKAGESLARQVDLTEYFNISNQGNYSVSAAIIDSRQQFSAASTNRVLFNLYQGRIYWAQKVGLNTNSKASESREMRILTFSDGQKNLIYAQIADGASGVPLKTFLLGDILLLRKPMASIDGQRCMHVMFMGTPSMWVHCQIDTNGKLLKRDLHQSPLSGHPELMAYGDGSVRVVNSIPYDADAVARERSKIRNISDRP